MNKIVSLILVISFIYLLDIPTTYAIFEAQNINAEAATQNSEGENLISNIFEFANIFAAFVLAISVLGFIYGALRLKWTLEPGVQWHRDTRLKYIMLYSGIGIFIAMSAFTLGRLFAGFGV